MLNALPLLLALVPSTALSQEVAPAPLATLSRPGDGSAVCGLGKAFHAGRRADLMQRVEGVLLFRGLPETRDYVPFRQDKTFWYLTGIESPDAALVLDADAQKEILLLPQQNKRKEGWEGEIWDHADEWVRDVTGFDDVRSIDDLEEVLKEVLGERKVVSISKHPAIGISGGYDRAGPYDRHQEKDPFDQRPSREQALEQQLIERLGVEVKDVAQTLIEMRFAKTDEELAAMRRAARAGAAAMSEAMRSTRPGLGEWELDALMTFVQVVEGAQGPAYHAIVGGGPNSCVLHYSANSRAMRSGEVVLIDYGPEVDHYTTDITRTWPVNGEFSERMTEIYDAVLEAQLAGIAAVRPGRTIAEINAVCNEVLREKGFGSMIRHGACHFIGMEVHDPGPYEAKFVPGVAFTVEPGLYETATGIGVRIEDVVVVTAEGCDVITRDVPKDRATIQALIRAEGVLDRMAADASPSPASAKR